MKLNSTSLQPSHHVMLLATNFLLMLLLSGCRHAHDNRMAIQQSNLAVANSFIDAFYSFNTDSLKSILAYAEDSQPNIMYYQKWAECGHYEILARDKFRQKNDSTVIFPVTVKDDLMEALKISFHVTDTFYITIRDGQIRNVDNSSNDPDVYYEAKEWVKQNRAEWIEKACEGAWEGGPTPCECIRGIIKGFHAFIETRRK